MILNILFGILVVGITVTMQGHATFYWLARLKRVRQKVNDKKFIKSTARILITTAFFLTSVHLIQAGIWALLYLWIPGITEFETFEKALYFSLVTFTSLGYGEITIGSGNRILAGLEALNGILLLGWSTALIFAIFAELLKIDNKIKSR